jgi:D-amino-acid oxidase
MEVTVVGAGVIGLATAVTLEERGHRVRVVAAARGEATTSAVAAAVWFPYRVGPRANVLVWAARTRSWLERLAHSTPEAGVDLLTCYEIIGADGTARPWWAEGLEAQRVTAPVAGAPPAWRYTAPRAQPSLLLSYLESRLAQPIEQRVVTDLSSEPGDVVVNCTGLGARELANDRLVEALLGQVAIAELGALDPTTSVTDDRDPERIFYLIPRRDEVVIGGCSLAVPAETTPRVDPATTERILAHAQQLGISVGSVRTERVGLRPYRPEVRLGRDGRIIHNYGHGGAGFTLCRGCAEDVAALIAQPK